MAELIHQPPGRATGVGHRHDGPEVPGDLLEFREHRERASAPTDGYHPVWHLISHCPLIPLFHSTGPRYSWRRHLGPYSLPDPAWYRPLASPAVQAQQKLP